VIEVDQLKTVLDKDLESKGIAEAGELRSG
jgi:hypothetical protein